MKYNPIILLFCRKKVIFANNFSFYLGISLILISVLLQTWRVSYERTTNKL